MEEQLDKCVGLIYSDVEGDPKIGFECLRQLAAPYRKVVDAFDRYLNYLDNRILALAIIPIVTLYDVGLPFNGKENPMADWNHIRSTKDAIFIPNGIFDWAIWANIWDKMK